MSRLPNGDLALGAAGWTVVTSGAVGARHEVVDRSLRVDARGAAGTPSAGVSVFSPRRQARAGQWSATVQLSCDPPALVDVALVAGREVPVPGPPPQAAPYTAVEVGAGGSEVVVTRTLDDSARTAGVRIRCPLGSELRIHGADVAQEGEPAATALAVALQGAREPFSAGAVVVVDELLDLTVAVTVDARVVVVLEDRYRGGERVLLATDLPARQSAAVQVTLDGCGAYAVTARATTGDEQAVATLRLVADVDADRLPLDRQSPWGVTANVENVEAAGLLLDLLGMAHTRIYSGFAAWDLPAVLQVEDPYQAAALVDALHFTGAPAGSAAAIAARRVSGDTTGAPRAGWPEWRTAAQMLRPGAAAPMAELLEPLGLRSVLAEMSQLDDLETWSAVVREVASGLAGRGLSWVAANEPDLGMPGTRPEQVARVSAAFARGVRSGDPAATLVGPALADGWDGGHQGLSGWDWLQRWACAGGADAVDVVSVHLHMLDEETQTPEREDLEGLLRRLQQLLAAVAPQRPLWVTEMGWRSTPDSAERVEPAESGPAVPEADQADLLVRAAVLAASCGVERFYAFHLNGFRSTGEGHRFAWGLCSGHGGGPKPAFAALRSLARATHGLTADGPLTTSTRVRAIPFLGSERDVHVVWQWTGGPGLWSLAELASVRVTDLLGAPSAGSDLRRPHLVHSATAERAAVQRRLLERLAPRHGEPQHPFHSHPEVSHVPSP